MKKIIAAFDGLKYSNSTASYAAYLANLANTHLVGVFLEDMSYHSYRIYDLVQKEGVTEKELNRLEIKDAEIRLASVKKFEDTMNHAQVQYAVHKDHKIAIRELLHESIYADLLIIDSKETLTHYDEKLPTRFIRDLLTETQCPVLLVPPKFTAIQKIIMLYDGTPTSMHAIKMFSYLIPAFHSTAAEVLSVKPPGENLHIKDSRLMKEFMKRHFPNVQYRVIKGLAETEILNHLKMQLGNTLVVLGAYQRSRVSRWFKPSMADMLMKEFKLPLFIAHSK